MRIQKLMVAFGRKGVGKTFETMNMIRNYVIGNPTIGVPGRRVLVLDVNNEFENIKTISLRHIQIFSAHPMVEARRIIPFNDDGTKMTLDQITDTLFTIVQEFKNGLLVIEDINKYVGDNMPQDLIGAICTNRHSNMDVIMHYQSIGRIQTKVWQNLNVIRFHKIQDSVGRHVKKFEDNAEMLLIAELIVDEMYQINPRFFLYVDIEETKIYANVSKDVIEKSINNYIYNNYKKVVKSKAGVINPAISKNKLTEEQVIVSEKNRMIKTYFS